jgi:type II secretory pathway pseudopilin PulG
MDGTEVKRSGQSGMTLIEVMLSAFLITVSLLAVAAAMGQGISAMFFVQEQLIAKQKARELMESVFTARSTQNIDFTDLESIPAEGIFVVGWQPIRDMGLDGIGNTEDDGDVETIAFPGPDGNLGTEDDEIRALTNFERRITFSDVLTPDNDVDEEIRKITVEVRFQANGRWWPVTISSYISKFA